MENKVLEQNLKQIKHYDSNLYNEILMFNDEKSNIQLAQNQNGEYNLLYQNIPLHSINGAIDEANKIAQNFSDKNDSIKIIYGLGLGYLADSAREKIQKGKIIIYEPNLDIVKFTLSIAQLDVLLEENVFLCCNKKKLKEHIFNFANENSELSVSFLNSYKSFVEDIKDVLYLAQSTQGEIIGNKNTLAKIAPSVFMHTLFNFGRVAKNPSIVQLANIYKGKTALILCAGPSLEKNIEVIKKNQDKFVIFALNPTLKLLKKHDIKPDFIVAIETSNIIKQFEGLDSENHYFIIEPSVNHRVCVLKNKKMFNYISCNNFFNDWILNCLKCEVELPASGTVSHTALISAYLMGFEKIVLIGQDLAYKDGMCYSKECQWGIMECVYDENEKRHKIIARDFEKLAQAFKTDDKTIEQARKIAQERMEFLNKNICSVKSTNGSYIPSKTDYAIFIECFKNFAIGCQKNTPFVELINSSFGAQIDGFENIEFDKVVKNLDNIEKLNLEKYSANYDKKHILNEIDILLEQMKRYQKLLEKLINNPEDKEALAEIDKMKNEKNIGFIVRVHLSKEECFKMEYLKKINNEILFDIKGLSNSKTFILE